MHYRGPIPTPNASKRAEGNQGPGGGSDSANPLLRDRTRGTLSWPRNSTRGYNVNVPELVGS